MFTFLGIYPSSCKSFGSYGWMGEVGLWRLFTWVCFSSITYRITFRRKGVFPWKLTFSIPFTPSLHYLTFFVPFVVFCREGVKRFTNRRFGKIYPSSCNFFGSYGRMGKVGLWQCRESGLPSPHVCRVKQRGMYFNVIFFYAYFSSNLRRRQDITLKTLRFSGNPSAALQFKIGTSIPFDCLPDNF